MTALGALLPTALATTGAPAGPARAEAISATLVVGGTTFPTLSQQQMSSLTNTYSTDLVNVAYPAQLAPVMGTMSLGASVSVCAANLLETITATAQSGGCVVVWGISQGALVLDDVQRQLASDLSKAPAASSLVFVRVADPANPSTGILSHVPTSILSDVLDYRSTMTTAPESQYNTIIITNEYDGFADWPERPENLIADLNALVGLYYRHGQTAFVNLAEVPARDITTTINSYGATTTTYLVPSPWHRQVI